MVQGEEVDWTMNARSLIPPLFLLGAACSSQSDEPVTLRNIEATCIEEAPDESDWTCDETRTVACEDVDDTDLEIVVEYDEGTCEDADLQDVEGPFEVGEHQIEIEDAASGDVVCTATLEVVDEHPPEAETELIEIWPPNHKMVDVSLDECIVDIYDCDDDVDARILWVTSDEADDANGDGNTTEDIAILASDLVSLRAERAGGSNGRVYTIGFELADHHDNVSEGECVVWVPHDQGGSGAVDDGPAVTVEAD